MKHLSNYSLICLNKPSIIKSIPLQITFVYDFALYWISKLPSKAFFIEETPYLVRISKKGKKKLKCVEVCSSCLSKFNNVCYNLTKHLIFAAKNLQVAFRRII